MNADAATLFELRNLKVHFPVRRSLFQPARAVRAVDGVNLKVARGEVVGLVGESGCGKSTTARASLGLVRPTGGEVHFEGKRIDRLSAAQMRPLRRRMQMVFQDPLASLNPRRTVGQIVAEPMKIFGLHDGRRRKIEVLRLLDLVGLNPRHAERYPHEFSGGQRQRVGIARALAVQPDIIFCDEPVSALDVSIQAQVINLMMDLRDQFTLSYIFIAHDLSVVRHVSDRIGVMYLGRLVEIAPAEEVCTKPRHPYTQALLSAVPIPDPPKERSRERIVLEGEAQAPDREIPGCVFASRCPRADDRCHVEAPQLEGDTHQVACFKPIELK